MNSTTDRILLVIECLSKTAGEGLSAAQVCDQTRLASSTVYRILSELEAAGFAFKSPSKLFLPNYFFERRVSAGRFGPEQLSSACASVNNSLHSASEIILLRGPNLLWHHKTEHPEQALRLRAHAGFVRGTYEMDSISRLALAQLPVGEIEKHWDAAGFFEVGVAGEKISWQMARTKIQAVDPGDMEFDMQGNAKGVRRFCVAVNDTNGKFICLMTVAEAATPLRDEETHILTVRNVLMDARAALLSTLEDNDTDPRLEFGLG